MTFFFLGRSQYYIRGKDSIGIRYGNYILLIISFLLIIREIFTIATVTNSAKQSNEHSGIPSLLFPKFSPSCSIPHLDSSLGEMKSRSILWLIPHHNHHMWRLHMRCQHHTRNLPHHTQEQHITRHNFWGLHQFFLGWYVCWCRRNLTGLTWSTFHVHVFSHFKVPFMGNLFWT